MSSSGRTELVIEAAGSGPSDFVLEPWTPAILPDAQGQTTKLLGARDSGLTSLWIDQSPSQTIALDWELKPRSHPHGRSFTLALPGDGPLSWPWRSRRTGSHRAVRVGDEVRVRPPTRIGTSGKSKRNPVSLTFISTTRTTRARRTWERNHGFPARRKSTCRGVGSPGGLANWTTDWRVELDPRNLKHLEVELDPGLELIDVQGPCGPRVSHGAVGIGHSP